MRLGEGTGAVCVLGLLKTALAVYNSGHVFADLAMEPYVPQ
jgi:NaMN:DMB phosphoribosyltransferase